MVMAKGQSALRRACFTQGRSTNCERRVLRRGERHSLVEELSDKASSSFLGSYGPLDATAADVSAIGCDERKIWCGRHRGDGDGTVVDGGWIGGVIRDWIWREVESAIARICITRVLTKRIEICAIRYKHIVGVIYIYRISDHYIATV